MTPLGRVSVKAAEVIVVGLELDKVTVALVVAPGAIAVGENAVVMVGTAIQLITEPSLTAVLNAPLDARVWIHQL